jgi:hypothetical protein
MAMVFAESRNPPLAVYPTPKLVKLPSATYQVNGTFLSCQTPMFSANPHSIPSIAPFWVDLTASTPNGDP